MNEGGQGIKTFSESAGQTTGMTILILNPISDCNLLEVQFYLLRTTTNHLRLAASTTIGWIIQEFGQEKSLTLFDTVVTTLYCTSAKRPYTETDPE